MNATLNLTIVSTRCNLASIKMFGREINEILSFRRRVGFEFFFFVFQRQSCVIKLTYEAKVISYVSKSCYSAGQLMYQCKTKCIQLMLPTYLCIHYDSIEIIFATFKHTRLSTHLPRKKSANSMNTIQQGEVR